MRLFAVTVIVSAVIALTPSAEPASVFCMGRVVTIHGTPENDVLLGTPLIDVISADRGGDTIIAGDGTDFICGGRGKDVLHGGKDFDHGQGGRGRDTCISIEKRKSCHT